MIENGGSLAFKDQDGMRFIDVVKQDVPGKLADIYEKLQGNRKDLGVDAYTEIKLGRTIVDLTGITDPSSLASRIDELIGDPSVRTVNAGGTITVQDQGVNKAPTDF